MSTCHIEPARPDATTVYDLLSMMHAAMLTAPVHTRSVLDAVEMWGGELEAIQRWSAICRV